MTPRRWAATAALVLAAAVVVGVIALALSGDARVLAFFACLAGAGAAAWYAVLRRGWLHTLALGLSALALAGAVVIFVLGAHFVETLLIAAGAIAAVACARRAFLVRVALPSAPPPEHPVLFFNPKSGGGKATRFHLADEARKRGFEAVELQRGDDLGALVRGAVARGADGLAMAGGDGSQAIVASIASELGLPYACVPAGTRNHLALDLGVDRNDVVGGLDAFVEGGERIVDLAEVNGRVFVNNVSLGLYAQAVQRSGYRNAKLRTILDTVPDVLGPEAERGDLRWRGPGGRAHTSHAAILVSNNRYRLGRVIGSGTRPRLDEGVLGITVLGADSGSGGSAGRAGRLREWGASSFDVEADSPVPAGIDGEAVVLDPPLRFRIRHRVLRVRIASQHPGASPSAGTPDRPLAAFRSLARIAAGHDDFTPSHPIGEEK